MIVGVIDDGLAFAHHCVLDAAGARIEFFWNQDRPDDGSVPYGWELQKNDIDAWLAASTHAGLADEDEIYRGAQHMIMDEPGHKPIAWRATHGTHVMDLACGSPHAGAPDDRPVLCVQLPVAATADSSGGTLEHCALDALEYMVVCAGPRPLVVNLSYGFIAGPHDGSGFLEDAMDELIAAREAKKRPLAIVLPSGNSYLPRCHARFSLLVPGDNRTLRWRVLPDDGTPSYLEIWLPHPTNAGVPRVTVQITSPTGVVIGPIGEGGVDAWETPDAVLCLATYFDTIVPGFNNRNMISITLAPTARIESAQSVAPSGVWEILVTSVGAVPIIDIDAWIERDDTPYGYPRLGRQSFFDDPDYRRFDHAGREIEDDNIPMSASYVKRDGTINSIATGEYTIVMAGFQRKWEPRSYFSNLPSLIPARYSASGRLVAPPPGIPPHRDSPDAMAVSDDAPAHHGILAAGARSGSALAMFGTSVAAPQITRWVADQMEAGNAYDRAAVAAEGFWHEFFRPPPNPQPQPERMGAGRIEFYPPHVPIDRFDR